MVATKAKVREIVTLKEGQDPVDISQLSPGIARRVSQKLEPSRLSNRNSDRTDTCPQFSKTYPCEKLYVLIDNRRFNNSSRHCHHDDDELWRSEEEGDTNSGLDLPLLSSIAGNAEEAIHESRDEPIVIDPSGDEGEGVGQVGDLADTEVVAELFLETLSQSQIDPLVKALDEALADDPVEPQTSAPTDISYLEQIKESDDAWLTTQENVRKMTDELTLDHEIVGSLPGTAVGTECDETGHIEELKAVIISNNDDSNDKDSKDKYGDNDDDDSRANKLCTLTAETLIYDDSSDILDAICAALPDPETLCASDFEHSRLQPNLFEPAHTLTSPHKGPNYMQSVYEFSSSDFTVPEDPSLWLQFQRKKYSRWAKFHPHIKEVQVRLIPQTGTCSSISKFNQPKCRACIGRVANKGCRFVNVRYITQLDIELTSGTKATRYLTCPVFRSEIEKAPAVRQPITPILLPGRNVIADDETSWTEFHILCETAGATKSMLRMELAVVRDLQVSGLRGSCGGIISFFKVPTLDPSAELDSDAIIVHPLYGCAPTPCIVRKVPLGAHQKCDKCAVPIFSAYFSCCMCMSEICIRCFDAWDDSDVNENYYLVERGTKKTSASGADNTSSSAVDMSYCKRMTQTGEDGKVIYHCTRHKKRQFIRVSHYSEDELELMLRKVNKIVQYCDHLDEMQPAGYSAISLCANELGLHDPDQKIDVMWTTELLDDIDCNTEIIASMGDAEFGADQTLRSGSKDNFGGTGALCAGPSRSQSHYLEAEWAFKLQTELLVPPQPLPKWHQTPVYAAAADLTLREFAQLWEDNHVVVVTGLLNDLELQAWSPDVLVQRLNKLPAQIYELSSKDVSIGSWTLGQFLHMFGGDTQASAAEESDDWPARRDKLTSSRLRACSKLQPGLGKSSGQSKRADSTMQGNEENAAASAPADMPGPSRRWHSGTPQGKRAAAAQELKTAAAASTADTPGGSSDEDESVGLMKRFNKLLDATTQKLPFPQYSSQDGSLNLANRLPTQYMRLDLRPELHCTYGSRDVGSRDNLRLEVADMVNLMVYASAEQDTALVPVAKGASAGIPRRASRGRPRLSGQQTKLSQVVEWTVFPPAAIQYVQSSLSDTEQSIIQIFEQGIYLDTSKCREIYGEYGDDAQSYLVRQQPGDAVFVPAGSAYQRCSFRNTVAIQSKFMSAEHMGTARWVCNEIARNKGCLRRKEMLPVMDILWWTWMGSPGDCDQSADKVISKSKKKSQTTAMSEGMAAAYVKTFMSAYAGVSMLADDALSSAAAPKSGSSHTQRSAKKRKRPATTSKSLAGDTNGNNDKVVVDSSGEQPVESPAKACVRGRERGRGRGRPRGRASGRVSGRVGQSSSEEYVESMSEETLESLDALETAPDSSVALEEPLSPVIPDSSKRRRSTRSTRNSMNNAIGDDL